MVIVVPTVFKIYWELGRVKGRQPFQLAFVSHDGDID